MDRHPMRTWFRSNGNASLLSHSKCTTKIRPAQNIRLAVEEREEKLLGVHDLDRLDRIVRQTKLVHMLAKTIHTMRHTRTLPAVIGFVLTDGVFALGVRERFDREAIDVESGVFETG